ncbi:unnamed protein product [Rhizopus microsporus]
MIHKKTSRGRKRRQVKRRRSQSSSEEESSEADSVTRCVCGKTHSVEEPDIPDHYYCELCKPENHLATRLPNGKMKREYSSIGHDKKTPKKRTTLNSREASMSLEDVLAVRNALELYESGQRSPSPVEKKGNNIEAPHEELPPIKEQDESDSEVIAKITRPKKKQLKTSERRTGGGRGKGGKRGKPRSRTSTPQPRDCSPALMDEGTPTSSQHEEPTTNIGTAIFEYFTPESRALSPPAKPRHPHARMSIYEMNRRAAQILEYISSIQIEMATKESNHIKSTSSIGASAADTITSTTTAAIETITETVDTDQNGKIDDDACSLSSASTIPLERDDDLDFHEPEKDDNRSSLEIMDMLTRKLIKFQKRFGTMHQEDEGRITRSREATSYGHALL